MGKLKVGDVVKWRGVVGRDWVIEDKHLPMPPEFEREIIKVGDAEERDDNMFDDILESIREMDRIMKKGEEP